MIDNYIKYIMPSIPHRKIKDKNDFRVRMASIQKEIYEKQKENGTAASKEQIISYVNEFFQQLGILLPINFNNVVQLKKTESRRINYYQIQKDTKIKNKNDIIWIKLNEDGCISVIGTGCDIYFTDKVKKDTSSGRINSLIGEKWNENEVLIFPLVKIPEGLNRSDVESGVGNYLISKGVPILDYYSHNY